MATQNVIDITKTGPATFRELIDANELGENADTEGLGEDFIQERRQRAAATRPSNGFNPAEDAPTYVESPLAGTATPFGQSMFDSDVLPESEWEHAGDSRAYNEPWYAKIGAGVAKGTLTAATTFIDGTLGLVDGLIEAVAYGDVSKIWDNHITNAMDAVSKWQEDFLPNYYTEAEQNAPWWQNLNTANFWGDSFIKNIGFTVGAFYGGGVWGAGLRAVGSLAKVARFVNTASKAAKATTALIGAGISAVGEGSIEALNAKNEFVQNNSQSIKESSEAQRAAALQEYEATKGQLIQGVGPDGNPVMYDAAYETYKQAIADIDAAEEAALSKVEEDAAHVGNVTLALNIPILTASNLIQFGKLYAGGYKAARMGTKITGGLSFEKNAAGEAVVKGAYKGGTKKAHSLLAAKSIFSEGNEEMMQKMASETAESYYTTDVMNYYAKQLDPDASVDAADWIRAAGQGWANSYGSAAAWEEGFIGGITGALGMPRFRSAHKTVKAADGTETKSWQSPIILEEGIWGGIRDYSETRAREKRIADALNASVNNPEYLNRWRSFVRSKAFSNDMDAAAIAGDLFAYKNAEFGQLISDIEAFREAGKTDDLKALIEYATDVSDESIDAIIAGTSSESSSEVQEESFDFRTTEPKTSLADRRKAKARPPKASETTKPTQSAYVRDAEAQFAAVERQRQKDVAKRRAAEQEQIHAEREAAKAKKAKQQAKEQQRAQKKADKERKRQAKLKELRHRARAIAEKERLATKGKTPFKEHEEQDSDTGGIVQWGKNMLQTLRSRVERLKTERAKKKEAAKAAKAKTDEAVTTPTAQDTSTISESGTQQESTQQKSKSSSQTTEEVQKIDQEIQETEAVIAEIQEEQQKGQQETSSQTETTSESVEEQRGGGTIIVGEEIPDSGSIPKPQGPFVDKSREEIKDALLKSRQKALDTIDNYAKTYSDVDAATGGVLSDEQLKILTHLKLQIQSWQDRGSSMVRDLKEVLDKILGSIQHRIADIESQIYEDSQRQTHKLLTPQKVKALEYELERLKDLEDVVKEILREDNATIARKISLNKKKGFWNRTIDHFSAQSLADLMAVLVSDPSIQDLLERKDMVKRLDDLIRTNQALELYEQYFAEWLGDPQKILKAQEKTKEEVLQAVRWQRKRRAFITSRQATNIAELNALIDLSLATDQLSTEDDEALKQELLDDLAEHGMEHAVALRQINRYTQDVRNAIDKSHVSQKVKDAAHQLLTEGLQEAKSLEELADPYTQTVTRDHFTSPLQEGEAVENKQLTDEYLAALNLLSGIKIQVNSAWREVRNKFGNGAGIKIVAVVQQILADNQSKAAEETESASDPTTTVTPVNDIGSQLPPGIVDEPMAPPTQTQTPTPEPSPAAPARPVTTPAPTAQQAPTSESTPAAPSTSGTEAANAPEVATAPEQGTSTTPPALTEDTSLNDVPVGAPTTDNPLQELKDENSALDKELISDDMPSKVDENGIQVAPRRMMITIIPYFDIDSKKKGQYVRFGDKQSRTTDRATGATVDFHYIYNYLTNAGAFTFVDAGNLSVGDTIGFMIDPEFEKGKYDDSNNYPSQLRSTPTIFMVVKEGPNEGQVVGVVPGLSSQEHYAGLADVEVTGAKETVTHQGLINRLLDEYKERNTFDPSSASKPFISKQYTTRVSQMMNGSVEYTDSETTITSSMLPDGDLPIFAVVTGSGVQYSQQDLDATKVHLPQSAALGRIYMFTKDARGGYSPIAVRVKRLSQNPGEFNLRTASQETGISGEIYNALRIFANPSALDIQINTAFNILRRALHISDIRITQERTDKNGNPYPIPQIHIDYVAGDKPQKNRIQLTDDIEQNIEKLLTVLEKYNLPIQITASSLSNPDYVRKLIDSGVLYTNVNNPAMVGNWFVVDFFNPQTGQFEQADPLPYKAPVLMQEKKTTAPAPEVVPTPPPAAPTSANTGNAVPGVPVEVVTNWNDFGKPRATNIYYIDLTTRTIRTPNGEVVEHIHGRGKVLLDDTAFALAYLKDMSGGSTEIPGVMHKFEKTGDIVAVLNLGKPNQMVINCTRQTYLMSPEEVNSIVEWFKKQIAPPVATTTQETQPIPQTTSQTPSTTTESQTSQSEETAPTPEPTGKSYNTVSRIDDGTSQKLALSDGKIEEYQRGNTVYSGYVYPIGEVGGVPLRITAVAETRSIEVDGNTITGTRNMVYVIFPNGRAASIYKDGCTDEELNNIESVVSNAKEVVESTRNKHPEVFNKLTTQETLISQAQNQSQSQDQQDQQSQAQSQSQNQQKQSEQLEQQEQQNQNQSQKTSEQVAPSETTVAQDSTAESNDTSSTPESNNTTSQAKLNTLKQRKPPKRKSATTATQTSTTSTQTGSQIQASESTATATQTPTPAVSITAAAESSSDGEIKALQEELLNGLEGFSADTASVHDTAEHARNKFASIMQQLLEKILGPVDGEVTIAERPLYTANTKEVSISAAFGTQHYEISINENFDVGFTMEDGTILKRQNPGTIRLLIEQFDSPEHSHDTRISVNSIEEADILDLKNIILSHVKLADKPDGSRTEGNALVDSSWITNPTIDNIAAFVGSVGDSYGQLFDMVASPLRQVGLRLVLSDELSAQNPARSINNNTISLYKPYFEDPNISNEQKVHVLLHELIHAVTSYALTDQQSVRQCLSPQMQRSVEKLRKIYEKIKTDPSLQDEYGIVDVHEMVAELSNPKFRDKLKKISLWDQIIEAFKEFFGLADVDTAVYKTFMDILEIFDESAYRVYNRMAEAMPDPTRGLHALRDASTFIVTDREDLQELTETFFKDCLSSCVQEALKETGDNVNKIVTNSTIEGNMLHLQAYISTGYMREVVISDDFELQQLDDNRTLVKRLTPDTVEVWAGEYNDEERWNILHLPFAIKQIATIYDDSKVPQIKKFDYLEEIAHTVRFTCLDGLTLITPTELSGEPHDFTMATPEGFMVRVLSPTEIETSIGGEVLIKSKEDTFDPLMVYDLVRVINLSLEKILYFDRLPESLHRVLADKGYTADTYNCLPFTMQEHVLQCRGVS